ncbi:MAG TPA: DedA family protein [Thermoanaerobaculia bacterium]|nr:DedA family protein [Thermoanaerobaculia bacterium]
MKKLIAAFFSIPVGWCVAAVFLLTGAESALLIGFLVPGEVAAILGGVIASHGRVPLAAALAAAVAGAWCGDSAGYFLGRNARFFERRRRDRNWSRARTFLKKGGIAVLVGRFTPFLRTIMPAAAGAAKMPYERFLPWNLAGGLLWGSLSTLLGYWGGRNAEKVVHRAGLAGLGLLVVALAILAFLWMRFRRGPSPRPRPSARRAR